MTACNARRWLRRSCREEGQRLRAAQCLATAREASEWATEATRIARLAGVEEIGHWPATMTLPRDSIIAGGSDSSIQIDGLATMPHEDPSAELIIAPLPLHDDGPPECVEAPIPEDGRWRTPVVCTISTHAVVHATPNHRRCALPCRAIGQVARLLTPPGSPQCCRSLRG